MDLLEELSAFQYYHLGGFHLLSITMTEINDNLCLMYRTDSIVLNIQHRTEVKDQFKQLTADSFMCWVREPKKVLGADKKDVVA